MDPDGTFFHLVGEEWGEISVTSGNIGSGGDVEGEGRGGDYFAIYCKLMPHWTGYEFLRVFIFETYLEW